MDGEISNKKPYKSLLVTVAAILLGSFAIIMFNQVLQLIQAATAVDPILGRVVLVFFALLAVLALLSVILLLVRLEKALEIPDENNEEEYARYLTKLKTRLMRNEFLKKNHYSWDTGESDYILITRAIGLLDEESVKLIKRDSSAVFITTSVSQNGSLDGIFVFITAIKIVWKISMLYKQRPGIADLTKLYSNVFGTVLLARQIDDLDLVTEQLEPVISSLLGGSVGTLLPGVSYVVSFVVDSILEGSINTLLILRVGLITQKYCRSITKIEPRAIGKTATIQACDLLGNIISVNSKRIADALIAAIKNSTANSYNKGKKKFTGIFERIFYAENVEPNTTNR